MKKRIYLVVLLASTLFGGCDTLQTTTIDTFPSTAVSDLPTEGQTSIPILYQRTSSETPANLQSTSVSQEERQYIHDILTSARQMFGSQYVAFISRKRNDGTYHYRYKTLNVPDELKAPDGRTITYTYIRRDSLNGEAVRLLAAVIPDTPAAREQMNAWAGVKAALSLQQKPPPGALPPGLFAYQPVTPETMLKLDASVKKCEYSEQIVYHEECSCYGYEYVEVCGGGGGGGDEGDEEDDWIDIPPDCDNPFGCDGGGGDGTGGGGGGEEGCDPDEITCQLEDPGDIAKKSDIEDIFAACGVTNSKTQDDAFESNIRRAMGMVERTEEEGGQLDGYDLAELFETPVIDKIMEAKFASGWPVLSHSESKKHIDELNKIYTHISDNTITLLAPIYYVVSLYDGNNPELDFHGKTIEYAENHGVVIVDLKVREGLFGEYFIYGEAVTDWSLVTWGDFKIQLPSWLTNGEIASGLFSFDCSTE